MTVHRLPFAAPAPRDGNGDTYEPAPVEESLAAAYAILERLGHHAEAPQPTGEKGHCNDCTRPATLFTYGQRTLCHRCADRRRNVAANLTATEAA